MVLMCDLVVVPIWSSCVISVLGARCPHMVLMCDLGASCPYMVLMCDFGVSCPHMVLMSTYIGDRPQSINSG